MTLAHRNLDSIEERKRTTKDFFPHLKLPIALSSDNQFYQLHTLLPKTPLCTHKHAKHMYTHTCMLSHFSLCLFPCDPMNCSLPGSSARRISQARILVWVAFSSRGFSQPRDWAPVSLLHWHVDSLPWCHSGSLIFFCCCCCLPSQT